MGAALPVDPGFTGRVSELRIVDGAMAAARDSIGAVILVTGAAGIGKTRFCREVAARASTAGFAIAWGNCWPEGGAPPLWPWHVVLGSLCDPTAAKLLLDDAGGRIVDPERFTRFVAVVDRLGAECADRPSLVVIDDVHAADTGALLLARFIGRHLFGLPLVLVLAGRDDAGPGPDPPWYSEFGSDVVPIGLGGFDLAETRQFVGLRGHAEADDDLLGVLLRLTGGHPLHLERIMTTGVPGSVGGPGPDGIRAAIGRAIGQLDTPARLVLGRAAILGSAPVVAEVVAVAGVPPSAVHAALGEALPGGLVAVDDRDPDRFTFSHELVREAFEVLLTADERDATHARAAAMLADAGGAGSIGSAALARRAHHALCAARRSDADARTAVAACRAAARAMVAGFAYERAVSLLAAATAAHEQAALGDPVAALLVDWAEAVLLCGRLAEARPLFDRAAAAAATERDMVVLARATLGLGGVWVNEHRTQVEWERVAGLQRRALAELPEQHVLLRHRLTMRMAVEALYRGGPLQPVLAGLDEARRLGDGKVLAEALSLCHHGLLTARHTRLRLTMAEELITVAAPAGEGLLALIGLCWRTVDLFHLGDPRATRSLAELREHADAVGCQSVLYIAEAMQVMLLIRAGRLDEAEDAAGSCYALGTKVGDADALGYLGTHLTMIRWLQGREAEIVATIEQLADSPTLNPAEFGFQATAAQLAARAGRLGRARTVLDRLTTAGLAALPDSSTWLAGMLAIVEAAHLLADADLARQAYLLLGPHADLFIMPSLAVVCLGSVHRPLGLAALTFTDLDLAVTHLEQAVAADRAIGNRPLTAVTMAELAEAYLRRQADGDRARAVAMLTHACNEATAAQMTTYAATWTSRLERLVEQTATIDQRGQHWILTVGQRRAVVVDRLGVRYLAHLLANPGLPIAASELASGLGGPALASTPHQPVLDERAKADYRRRVHDLSAAIDRADERGDSGRVDQLRVEREALFDELRRATGRGGRTRSFADPGERARTAVRKAIKRAVDDIATADPAIGDLLRATITTGASCCYIVDADHPVRWTFTTAP
jgi:hypothetical protein